MFPYIPTHFVENADNDASNDRDDDAGNDADIDADVGTDNKAGNGGDDSRPWPTNSPTVRLKDSSSSSSTLAAFVDSTIKTRKCEDADRLEQRSKASSRFDDEFERVMSRMWKSTREGATYTREVMMKKKPYHHSLAYDIVVKELQQGDIWEGKMDQV